MLDIRLLRAVSDPCRWDRYIVKRKILVLADIRNQMLMPTRLVSPSRLSNRRHIAQPSPLLLGQIRRRAGRNRQVGKICRADGRRTSNELRTSRAPTPLEAQRALDPLRLACNAETPNSTRCGRSIVNRNEYIVGKHIACFILFVVLIIVVLLSELCRFRVFAFGHLLGVQRLDRWCYGSRGG